MSPTAQEPPAATHRAERLHAVLEHAGHYLPAQGPISVFVHHNTLHAFQHLPFHEAVAAASALFGTEGYLSEAQYHEHYRRGRITEAALEAALAERHRGGVELAPEPLGRAALERLALLYPLEPETEASLRWRQAEQQATRRLRGDVPEPVRTRLLERSVQGLRAWLEQVGQEWTMTDLAVALLEPSLEEATRAAAQKVRRRMAPGTALRRLGVPSHLGDSYVDCVEERLGRMAGVAVDKEAWLTAEATVVVEALAAAFGGDGSLPSLYRRLEQAPEALAVSALWATCRRPLLAAVAGEAPEERVRSHREVLLAVTGEDCSVLVHRVLIRACAAFLDEGVAPWPMPERHLGLYAAWRVLKLRGMGVLPPWLKGLREELARSESLGWTAESVVLAALDELGVPEPQWEEYLVRVLLALPGWAGMFHRLETHPEDRAPGAPPARLVDFLAVHLTLERYALKDVARRRLGYTGPLSGLLEHARRRESSQAPAPTPPPEAQSWLLFQLAQVAGLSAPEVEALPVARRQALLAQVSAFDSQARRRVWQEAYEHHYRMQVLQGLAQSRQRPAELRTVRQPRFQVLFCIDDREEAIRRHFEERSPAHETFGVAGFFGVAVDYRGLDDGGPASLCPVVVSPAHEVHERPHPEHLHRARARARLRALWARFDHWLHSGTRSLVLGWLFTHILGLLAPLALVGRVLMPRTTARLRRRLTEQVLPAPRTQLTTLRAEELASLTGKPVGFTTQEKADRVAATLQNVGLVEGFAPLVLLLGHGSVSVNNPHLSAYDCGACGGRHGGPNARLFADMANRPEVRAALRERGILIPEGTWFLGGMHNTATEEIDLYDVEHVPAALQGELEALKQELQAARALSAHERCRRFASAPEDPTPEQALHHVEERAEDLSQARPELGHVTNAACIVGRRSLSRGLFLDRRAFLVSYDPTRDATGSILERILLAVGPVGAGINLEYYFSCVDNDRYGCGTKLPHNITGLLGVMDGVESDLRTGLPRQMIEIHEPVRLLVVVEASVATLSALYERQPPLRELIGNEWIQLVSVDPETGAMARFTPRGFEPVVPPAEPLPAVGSSPEWYRGCKDFLGPALIDPARQVDNRERVGGAVHAMG